MGVYAWYLYGYAINRASSQISAPPPDNAPNERERAAFAQGLFAAAEGWAPQPAYVVRADVETLFSAPEQAPTPKESP